jgi:hypothetical protein
MGYHRSIVAALLAVATAPAQDDPANVLIRVREELLAMTARLPRYSCTETLDRSYFSRLNPSDPHPSCDQILGDRKGGYFRMRLDRTDRVRFNVAAPWDRELLSWTGVAPVSLKLDDLIESGPIATGSMGTRLKELFGSSATRFQYCGQNGKLLEFGFQVAPGGAGPSFGEGKRGGPLRTRVPYGLMRRRQTFSV